MSGDHVDKARASTIDHVAADSKLVFDFGGGIRYKYSKSQACYYCKIKDTILPYYAESLDV